MKSTHRSDGSTIPLIPFFEILAKFWGVFGFFFKLQAYNFFQLRKDDHSKLWQTLNE